MSNFKWIVGLGSITLLLVLAACGQKGPLYLPQEPAAQSRGTLPQVLRPNAAASAAVAPASAPNR